MNLTNFVDLYIIAGDQLDSLWEFFVTAHLAIIAALYAIEKFKRLELKEVLILGSGYVGFSLINLRAKIEAYDCLVAIEKDAQRNLAGSNLTELASFFERIQFDDRIAIVYVVHGLSVLGIIFLFRLRQSHQS